MITREDWDKGIEEGRIGSTLQLVSIVEDLFDQQDQLRQHIKSLETQLANTEQLTCKSEYFDLIKELHQELLFESKVLTREQCHGSLTRHNMLYERALDILENWHELNVEKFTPKDTQ